MPIPAHEHSACRFVKSSSTSLAMLSIRPLQQNERVRDAPSMVSQKIQRNISSSGKKTIKDFTHKSKGTTQHKGTKRVTGWDIWNRFLQEGRILDTGTKPSLYQVTEQKQQKLWKPLGWLNRDCWSWYGSSFPRQFVGLWSPLRSKWWVALCCIPPPARLRLNSKDGMVFHLCHLKGHGQQPWGPIFWGDCAWWFGSWRGRGAIDV